MPTPTPTPTPKPKPTQSPPAAHTPQTPLRVVMIGGGSNSAVGRVHDIALRMDHAYTLVGGCFSRNPAINMHSAMQYGLDANRVYDTPEALLKDMAHSVDAVVVATPIQDHARHIQLALQHKLRVISDKPLLASVAECQQLLSTVDNAHNSTQVFCIFNYTGYPAVREMKQRIECGEIGQVFKVMAEMPQDSYMRLKNQNNTQAIQSWRLQDGDIPCVSLDLFVHLHSLLHFIGLHNPLSVSAHSRAISGVAPGLVDEVDALIEYDNNAVANCWYGKAALGHRNGLRLRVYGTQGSLAWYQEQPEELLYTDAKGNRIVLDRISTGNGIAAQARYQRFKSGHPAGFIEAFANYYTDIAQAIAQGALNEYTLPLPVVLQGLELARAIAQSSAQQQRILFAKEVYA